MKEIQTNCYGIAVFLDCDGGAITSDLKEVCSCCSLPNCDFSCDESQATPLNPVIKYENDEEVRSRLTFNAQIDAIESLILAHSCAGIDITSPEYIEGIETAVQAIGNNVPCGLQ